MGMASREVWRATWRMLRRNPFLLYWLPLLRIIDKKQAGDVAERWSREVLAEEEAAYVKGLWDNAIAAIIPRA